MDLARRLAPFFGAATVLKLLFMRGYRSTDFEVHRNWLAVTASRPATEWYFEATSPGTLDYPPFFAFFELALAHVAALVDPRMLEISREPVETLATIYFQRLSVVVVDLVLFAGVVFALGDRPLSLERKVAAGALVTLNAGLFLVDHIHFQYNGFLLGVLLLTIGCLTRQWYRTAALAFASLLMLKHLFLSLAPLVFVFLLRAHCFDEQQRFSVRRFLELAVIVVVVCAVALLPVLGLEQPLANLQQLGSRLFPWGRGLVHAYWAPNVWALYNSADKALTLLFRASSRLTGGRLDLSSWVAGDVHSTALTGGLIGHEAARIHAVLPSPTPGIVAALVAIAMVPVLVRTWKNPDPALFLRRAVLCALAAFLFGWHVHEKAILVGLIPLTLEAVVSEDAGQSFRTLAAVAHVSLSPLLFQPMDQPTTVLLFLGFEWLADALLPSSQPTGLGARGYRLGLVVLVAVYHAYPILFWDSAKGEPRFPFLPLMLVSTYCALGVVGWWVRELLAPERSAAAPAPSTSDKTHTE